LKQEQHRVSSRKLVFYSAIVASLLTISVIFGISGYVGWKLTHPGREKVSDTPATVGLSYEDVSFKSREDGIDLKGWLIHPAANKGTIVFVHGYARNRLQADVPLLPLAKKLVDEGYAALIFDLRNSGESGGSLTSIGEYEVRDVLGAVDFVRSRSELSKKVVLFGFSMGGATSIIACAREPYVAGAIADAPFADLKSYLDKNLSIWTKLPSIPFNEACFIVVPLLTGINIKAVSPMEEVKHFKDRPLLLIHGDADTVVPLENSKSIQEAYPAAQLVQIHGAGHVKSYKTDENLYVQSVLDFLGKL